MCYTWSIWVRTSFTGVLVVFICCESYCCWHFTFMMHFPVWNTRFETLPACVYEMQQLEILCAANNQVKMIYVEGLTKLKRLATLDLHNNNIDFVPPQLGNVTQLRFVLILYPFCYVILFACFCIHFSCRKLDKIEYLYSKPSI